MVADTTKQENTGGGGCTNLIFVPAKWAAANDKVVPPEPTIEFG